MASTTRLIALWIHRWKKYTHILGKYGSFFQKYISLRLTKSKLAGRPLIAIVLSEQMGDIIACEPVAREVRRLHPEAFIIWFARKPYVELVSHHPDLDEVLVEKCPGEREELLRAGLFDLVFNMHLSHRKCKYCPEDPINPTADRLGITYFNYYFYGNLLHTFSQAAGLPPLSATPRMYITEQARQRIAALNLPPNPIVLHCQSSHVLRDWPANLWNQLARWLLETYNGSIIEIGLAPVVHLDNPRFQSLCGQLSLLETAEVIRQSRLFIGIDSGPAHMANAVGAEGVLLLGKLFDFEQYMPYSGRYKRGENVTILNNLDRPCAEMPYEWVQDAVAERLSQVDKV